TSGGVISLVFGSMILMDSPAPEFQLSLRIVLPVAVAFAAIAVMLVRLGVAAQRRPAVTGIAGMIGEAGQAVTPIGPTQPGRVAVHGEIWDATAVQPVAEGARVRIIAIDGLRVTVHPE
ncbi:MAG TPA: NfeD family protein, partial [Verrucomicrobiae bacterium]|nr:NfeD family protein [Verrucomicrobiae bacterium]